MKSIAAKLWLGIILLVIFMLFLLWMFQIVFLEKFYTDIKISGIKSETMDIMKEMEAINSTKEYSKLDELAHKNNMVIEVLDISGKVVYLTGELGGGSQVPMSKSNIRSEVLIKALEGIESSNQMIHPRFNSKFILQSLPVKISNKVEGALFLSIPIASIDETADILKKQLLYITIILLIVSIVIAYVYSKVFANPILKITRVSEMMASGKFDQRVILRNKDEIGKLAKTINFMGEELGKIEQLRKDLVANVSHELRTPLSIIRGYAETLRDVSGNNEEKRNKHLGIIIDETERLNKIVEDILNLSKLQSGYSDINMKAFAIKPTLERIVKKFDYLEEITEVNICLEASDGLKVNGDEGSIEQVLVNLLSNSIKHIPSGGTIKVNAIEKEKTVKIEVCDNGAGIAPEDVKYIWDRFYKVDKSGSRSSPGTGLGLAIVKSILEAHEALYGVESELGRGTTFWFEIRK